MDTPTPATPKKHWTNTLIGIVGALIIMGPGIYRVVRPEIDQTLMNWKLREFKPKIETCVKQKTQATEGQTIVGIDFECALDIAATIYSQDHEKALALCHKYSPFQSIYGGDRPSTRIDQQIQDASCELSIKERLNKGASK